MKRQMLFTLYLAIFSGSVVAEIVIPTDYDSIEAAVEAYNDNDFTDTDIKVLPGEYEIDETIAIPSGWILQGEETATTIIRSSSSTGGDPFFEVATTGVKIRRFTFKNANAAIILRGEGAISTEISNNVFDMGEENNAIEIDTASSPVPTITNNVFYENEYAITGSAATVATIKYNIFDNNAFVTDLIGVTQFSENCYRLSIDDTFEVDDTSQSGDPEFVNDPTDFHLTTDSPCIFRLDSGSGDTDGLDGSDIDYGAYGGQNADKFPHPVNFNIADPVPSGDEYSVDVTWNVNGSYKFTEDDGSNIEYKLYFDNTKDGEFDFVIDTELASPFILNNYNHAETEQSQTVSGITIESVAIDSPTITKITEANQRLHVEWTSVENTESYELSYQPAGGDVQTIDVGNVTEYSLTNLENGTQYNVSVSAQYQPELYFMVIAEWNNNEGNVDNKSQAEKAKFGEPVSSTPSDTVTATPDEIIPYPVLPNEGCFIATATYGSYDAPQVQVFRDFRDEVLAKSEIGRGFITIYYRYGPIAAKWVDDNAWIKPTVSAILYPYLLLSELMLDQHPLSALLITLIWLLALPIVLVFATRQLLARAAHG